MRLEDVVLKRSNLDIGEITALENTSKVIRKIQKEFSDGEYLVSTNTGECVKVEELGRTLGIIDFFLNNRVFEVDEK